LHLYSKTEVEAATGNDATKDEDSVTQNPVPVDPRNASIASHVEHPFITVVKDAAHRKKGTKTKPS